MRTYPTDEMEEKELALLQAAPWQMELLKKNPSYVYWGNFEDTMACGSGWNAPLTFATIQEGGLFELDDYNELVHFYFEITRKSKDCVHCEGKNMNEETKKIYEDWYSFDNAKWLTTASGSRYNDNAWSNHLTEIEIEALVKQGRLSSFLQERVSYDEETDTWYQTMDGQRVVQAKPTMPTPEVVNEWNREKSGHDAINRWIAVEARAKHLGVYGECPHCTENGFDYTTPHAHVSLQMWYLHPRKGASRGVYIEQIEQQDVPQVLHHLEQAKQRQNARFAHI